MVICHLHKARRQATYPIIYENQYGSIALVWYTVVLGHKASRRLFTVSFGIALWW